MPTTLNPSERADLPITGMTCAVCASRIERVLGRTAGVRSATINFATEVGTVQFDPAQTNRRALIGVVQRAGYDVLPDAEPSERVDDALIELRRRLVVAAVFAIPVVVLAMAHGRILGGSAGNWLQLALTVPVMTWAAVPILRPAWGALRHGAADMNTLVTVGTLAAFLYSVVATVAPGLIPVPPSAMPGMAGMPGMPGSGATAAPVYFEAAASVVTLVLLGRWLEHRARHRAGDALRRLLTLRPAVAVRIRDGVEAEVAVARIVVGDQLLARPGAAIAVDGKVEDGASSVDEAMLTGESVPVAKSAGASVYAGTINGRGALRYVATGVGKDTALARISRQVEEAQAAKADIQRVADKVAGIFTPVVIVIAAVTFAAWIGLTGDVGMALLASVSVLIIACPCAMGLATPTAILVGTGRGAEIGVLVRNGAVLERAERVDVVAFDKTGTLTEGRPALTDVVLTGALDRATVLRFAAAVERESEHPLAGAVLRAADPNGPRATDFEATVGGGVAGTFEGHAVRVGSVRWLTVGTDPAAGPGPSFDAIAAELGARGVTALAVEVDGALVGVIGVADPIKPGAAEAIARLRAQGVTTLMLSGDREEVAQAVAAQLGLDRVVAGVLPEGKAAEVQRLRAAGHVVAMVGDGVNDAPALAAADLGIAMGRGADAAKATADITLLRDDLSGVVDALALSRATMRTIRANLFWAFLYNSVGIPVAAGVLYPLTGWLLSPMIASAAMAFSSVSVVLNSLRLRRFRGGAIG